MTGPGAHARATAWLRRNAEWLWAPAVYLAIALFLYREIWLPEKGALHWFGWDCLDEYWPYLAFMRRAAAAGHLPLWNPYEDGGVPFYGDMQAAIFYPVNWLFTAVGLVIRGCPPWMIQAKALLHHVLAGALMHAYLRSRRLPPAAAVFGGTVAIANGAMLFLKASNVIWPVIWSPLIWIAIDRAVEGAREPGWWRRGVALAGALMLAGTAGSPSGFFYTLVITGSYGLLRMAQILVRAAREQRIGPELAAQARTLAIATGVTLALILIVYLPARDLAVASPRVTRPPDWPFAGPSPDWQTLKGAVSPAFGISIAYAGALLVPLALAALAARPLADRGAPIFFFVAGFVVLLLSFGKQTPVLPFLVAHVPGFKLFRAPPRYDGPAMLLLAAAAAHGLAALLDRPQERRFDLIRLARTVTPFAVTIALLLAMWLRANRPHDAHGHGPATSLLAFLAGCAVLAAVLLAPRRIARVAAAALALVALVDFDHYVHDYSLMRSERPVDDQEDRRWLAGLDGDITRDWRIYDEFILEQTAGSRLGVRDFRGYPPGNPLQTQRYVDVFRRVGKNPELLQAFNVRWLFHGPHHRSGFTAAALRRAPPQEHYKAIDGKRWEALHPAAAVAWYGEVEIVPDEKRALDALVAAEAEGTHAAVIERGDLPAALRSKVPPPPHRGWVGTYHVGTTNRFEPNRVTTEIDAPADGLLILNEAWSPGWRVTVDGRRATPLRANVLLRAVLVPAGHHVVDWTFHPPHYAWLFPLWLLGMLSLLAAAAARPLARALAPVVTPLLRRSGILRACDSGNARPPSGDARPPM